MSGQLGGLEVVSTREEGGRERKEGRELEGGTLSSPKSRPTLFSLPPPRTASCRGSSGGVLLLA